MESPIYFSEPHVKTVEQIKYLNDACFPIKYSQKFYEDLFRPERKNLSILAYYGTDVLCGGILCRYESEDEPGVFTVYLMTIAVLEPYRRLGIGTMLLNRMIENLEKLGNVRKLKLHVWTTNENAIEFYKKNGFTMDSIDENYYSSLEPKSAWVIHKEIVPSESK